MRYMSYHHPYEPYAVQKAFMDAMYDTLEHKKVGIFESPTGTGKTLSLICPAVTWLRNAEEQAFSDQMKEINEATGPQWMKEAAKERIVAKREEQAELLRRLRKSAEKAAAEPSSKRRQVVAAQPTENTHLAQFLLDDVDESVELFESLQSEDGSLDALKPSVQIYYTSRTHSQLSQLVGTLKLLKIPSIFSKDEPDPIRSVTLGSRKQLCVHPEVMRLESLQQINDKCMDMQTNGPKCEFRKVAGSPEMCSFRNDVLANIMDIEELASYGKRKGVCPYYGSRDVSRFCEVVALPYNLLLEPRARQAMCLTLDNAVIIVDEAHNLINVISSIHSSSLTAKQVVEALAGLQFYEGRVGNRLSPKNRGLVAQTIKVVSSLGEFFEKAGSLGPAEKRPGLNVARAQLFGSVDGLVNMYELQDFIHKSKLSFKVDSYLKHERRDSAGRGNLVLAKVTDFLALAMDPYSDGKIFWDRNEQGELALRYLLLDTDNSFRGIVTSARCVVLAGGTMEPVEDYLRQLVPYVDRQDIVVFSCDHVISAQNLLVEIITKGPTETRLELTFAKRTNAKQIDEVGGIVLELIKRVPAGFITFFPSYMYLGECVKRWTHTGLLEVMSKTKRVFSEDKRLSAEALLAKYAEHIGKRKGALLFAVVEGKLSEGINFSDDLARGVAVVGLPFPNAFSAELVARKQHVMDSARSRGASLDEAREEAREYYENLSLRAVNQSVGRAIRHINDYAAIFLLDSRYGNVRIERKLSKWIRKACRSRPLNLMLAVVKDFFNRT